MGASSSTQIQDEEFTDEEDLDGWTVVSHTDVPRKTMKRKTMKPSFGATPILSGEPNRSSNRGRSSSPNNRQ